MSFSYINFFEDALEKLRAQKRYRTFLPLERCAQTLPTAYGTQGPITIWCGNDYLGLNAHPEVIKAMCAAAQTMGVGAGGTRNISGTNPWHEKLEKTMAGLHQKEKALLFTSGYIANATALETLATHLPDCVIFSDEKNHASLIQGIRHSRRTKHIFPHKDLQALERLLSDCPPHHPKLIVCESVYSMDGDIFPLEPLCNLADHFGALIYLDEVHGVGLYGENGAGIAERDGVLQRIDLIQGTLGKAFGNIGGYITGNAPIIDFLRSYASGFIFTTALPPALMAAAHASVTICQQTPQLRAQHHQRVETVKSGLRAARIPFLDHGSHIIPLMVYDAGLCKTVSQYLLQTHRIYLQAINFPTVPQGTERMRLTPSAAHTPEMVTALLEALVETWETFDLKKAAAP